MCSRSARVGFRTRSKLQRKPGGKDDEHHSVSQERFFCSRSGSPEAPSQTDRWPWRRADSLQPRQSRLGCHRADVASDEVGLVFRRLVPVFPHALPLEHARGVRHLDVLPPLLRVGSTHLFRIAIQAKRDLASSTSRAPIAPWLGLSHSPPTTTFCATQPKETFSR